MDNAPNQEELDRLGADIARTREQAKDDRIPESVQETQARHERGEDLMPRTDDGNPM